MRRSFQGPSAGESRDGPSARGGERGQVSKNVQGGELIPPKYNTQTVLGQEIVPDAEGRGTSCPVRLRLTRR